MIGKLMDKLLGSKEPVGHEVIVCRKCGFRRCSCISRCPGRCRSRDFILESLLGTPCKEDKDRGYWKLPLPVVGAGDSADG